MKWISLCSTNTRSIRICCEISLAILNGVIWCEATALNHRLPRTHHWKYISFCSQGAGSTLVQVMACWQTVPSHYRNQCGHGEVLSATPQIPLSQDMCMNILTHWGRDKMDAISQTTFSSAFSWMKMFEFRLNFHWNLFLRVQLTIFQHWFR